MTDDEDGEEDELRLPCEGSYMLKMSSLSFIVQAEEDFIF